MRNQILPCKEACYRFTWYSYVKFCRWYSIECDQKVFQYLNGTWNNYKTLVRLHYCLLPERCYIYKIFYYQFANSIRFINRSSLKSLITINKKHYFFLYNVLNFSLSFQLLRDQQILIAYVIDTFDK